MSSRQNEVPSRVNILHHISHPRRVSMMYPCELVVDSIHVKPLRGYPVVFWLRKRVKCLEFTNRCLAILSRASSTLGLEHPFRSLGFKAPFCHGFQSTLLVLGLKAPTSLFLGLKAPTSYSMGFKTPSYSQPKSQANLTKWEEGNVIKY